MSPSLTLFLFFLFLPGKSILDSGEAFSNLGRAGSQSFSSFPDSETKGIQDKAAQEDSTILFSPLRAAKRKRGRPTGEGKKKGKVSVSQARGTRARIRNKPARICEDQSDASGSSRDKTNEGMDMKKGKVSVSGALGTRTHVRNKHARICEDQSDASGSSHDETNKGMNTNKGHQTINETVSKENSEVQDATKVEDLESLDKGGTSNREVAKDNWQHERFNKVADVEIGYNRLAELSGKAPDIGMGESHGQEESDKAGKLEIMVDPVHAMLIDMIPSLEMKKVETTNPILHNEKAAVDPGAQPVKKKRVSYKDVAGELLKDC